MRIFFSLIALLAAVICAFMVRQDPSDVRGYAAVAIFATLGLALMFPKLRTRVLDYWFSQPAPQAPPSPRPDDEPEPGRVVWLTRRTSQKWTKAAIAASFATIALWIAYLATGGGEVFGVDLRLWAKSQPLRWPALGLLGAHMILLRLAYGIQLGSGRMVPEVLIYAPRTVIEFVPVVLRALTEMVGKAGIYIGLISMVFEVFAFTQIGRN